MTAAGPYRLHIGPALLNTARRLNRDERRELRRLLALVQQDPFIDGVHKILLAPDAPFTTYVSPLLYLFFYVEGGTIFAVDAEPAT